MSASNSQSAEPPRKRWPFLQHRRFLVFFLASLTLLFLWRGWQHSESFTREKAGPLCQSAGIEYYCPPLVMTGGDPYLRALMRTISASEANAAMPYSLLYGGSRLEDLSQHPDQCVPIVAGPNQGDCTTAAGRYQFITTTWLEKAEQYHPAPSGMWMWTTYGFEPEFQDQVTHAWLNDPEAWQVDIPALLRDGKLRQVLQLLSGTWTSLGYGIEDNTVTPYLEGIYQQMLQKELAQQTASEPAN